MSTTMYSMQAAYTPSPAANIISCIVGIVCIVAMWKLFVKAGKPGWAAIIPFYNMYVLYKLAFGKAKQFFLTFACGIVGAILLIYGTALFSANNSAVGMVLLILGALLLLVAGIIAIMMYFKLATAFGKGTGFGFGLWLLNPIFLCILAFGAAQYVGANK